MKRFLMLMVTFFSLLSISAYESAAVDPQKLDDPYGFVTVEGTVYIWTLDYGSNATAAMDDFAVITGGEYRRAPNLYVEVEFGWVNLDETTYTDDYGHYRITHGNPIIGDYSVDIEVRAEVMLNSSEDNLVDIFPAGTDLLLFSEGRTNIFPYNGQTDTASVGDGETVTMDVYIGGPGHAGGYSITEWWDDYPSDHLIGFYSVEAIREAYRWAVTHGIPAGDIERPTYMLYGTGGGIKYAPFTPPPGRAHIDISSQDLYPNEIADPGSIGGYWENLRGSLLHEYGHKIMHDVYTVLPMSFGEPKCTGHGVSSAIAGECGFVEGWAEFFAAAVRNRPTINGDYGVDVGISNIEHTYTPTPIMRGLGSITWRDQVPDNKQHINEGENAAVFWDIYDPKGWEYMLPAEQRYSRIYSWPTPMHWYDRLNSLEDIWTILEDKDPDRMWDESNTGLWGALNDGFWAYWRERFGSDGAKIHGLKAILYNREINPWPLEETAPTIQIVSVDLADRKAQVKITEADVEDRRFLYFNLAYRRSPSTPPRLQQFTDLSTAIMGGSWEGDTLTLEVRLPPAAWVHDLFFMVHDSMKAGYAFYRVSPGEGALGDDDGSGPEWRELSLEDAGLARGRPSGEEMIAYNGLLYVAADVWGLHIYDIQTSPGDPTLVGSFSYQDFNPPQSSFNSDQFLPFSIELAGNTIFVADTDSVNAFDVSDPANPTLISRLMLNQPPADFSTYGLEYYEGYLYYTAGYEGLYILRVKPDGQLEFVGKLDDDDYQGATDVVVFEDTLYMLREGEGMLILDLTTDKANPGWIGWMDGLPGDVRGPDYDEFLLDSDNERLYIPVWSSGIYILDISSPQVPVVQTIIPSAIYVSSLSLQDDILYTAANYDDEHGISAYDVRNIAEPVLLDHLDSRPDGQTLAVGDYIYIGMDSYMSLVRIVMP